MKDPSRDSEDEATFVLYLRRLPPLAGSSQPCRKHGGPRPPGNFERFNRQLQPSFSPRIFRLSCLTTTPRNQSLHCPSVSSRAASFHFHSYLYAHALPVFHWVGPARQTTYAELGRAMFKVRGTTFSVGLGCRIWPAIPAVVRPRFFSRIILSEGVVCIGGGAGEEGRHHTGKGDTRVRAWWHRKQYLPLTNIHQVIFSHHFLCFPSACLCRLCSHGCRLSLASLKPLALQGGRYLFFTLLSSPALFDSLSRFWRPLLVWCRDRPRNGSGTSLPCPLCETVGFVWLFGSTNDQTFPCRGEGSNLQDFVYTVYTITAQTCTYMVVLLWFS